MTKQKKLDALAWRAEERARRLDALKQIEALERRVGVVIFSWAARKYLSIKAAERSAERIKKTADERIAKLKNVARV